MSIALREWVEQALGALQARTLTVSHEMAMEAYALPEPFHKDPADRLLVAAARCHELTLLTADERILGYRGVRSRDARRLAEQPAGTWRRSDSVLSCEVPDCPHLCGFFHMPAWALRPRKLMLP